jgi:hypothetical protein
VDPLIQKVANTAPRNGKEFADILGGPAYLVPPLGTLFESLMTHFLAPRPPEDESIRVPGLPGGDEEDTNMNVDESQDNLLVSSVRAERVVDAREIEALIQLFQHHGVKGKRHRNVNERTWLTGAVSTITYSPSQALKWRCFRRS